jgi:hypothetical protein
LKPLHLSAFSIDPAWRTTTSTVGEHATARIQEQMLSDLGLVKRRTAASGAVWRSADGPFYKRTGGESVRGEAAFQIDLAKRGYPVPSVTECGLKDGIYYFVEPSAGVSLHDQALASADPFRTLSYCGQGTGMCWSWTGSTVAAQPVLATPAR